MTDTDDPLLVETRDGRMILTLNRPEALNAQTDAMRLALLEAYDAFDADDGLSALILRGAGRAFSAGADLKESGPADPTPWEATTRHHLGMVHFERLEQVRKPTIACMQGYAVGGGLELALCADIRIATLDARLGTPEPRTFGGKPGVALHRLTRLIPHGEAMRILVTSQPIDAERAYQIGLVQELATDVDDMARIADEMVDQILECSPSAIKSIKQVARWGYGVATAQSRFFGEHTRDPEWERADHGAGMDYLANRDEPTPDS